ncbi:ribosomal maturation YjgA family protein [Clostridium sp. 'White wine YQ']|uniref:ribosomal maturation YjgA family protein n=1 Tax=Clostridium sp. 'White wine YQ' TaxID=3027474 RepID=UPI002365AD92|nr:DUF2809 domain-containing protein [Clostridium sp. 'White wine YQ']MDD7793904.1 DUF2809 domain-containing protein [Clostridium sp. 'White wine YQ']
MIYKRNRTLYGIIIILVIVLGLMTRRFKNLYLGDILWALMIFFIVGFIFIKIKLKIAALIATSFCFIIEFSQLYHADWIDKIRQNTLGGLILGYVFSWPDLLAYLVGIGAGVILELIIYGIKNRNS